MPGVPHAQRTRVVTAVLLAVGLVGYVLLPPEHLHAGKLGSAHDHERIVHRHASPHPHAGGARSSFGHSDESAPQFWDTVFLPAPGAAAPHPAVGGRLPIISPSPQIGTRTYERRETRPVHGPPRINVGLRAPPLISVPSL
jgi:hypothetical protein